MSGHQPAMAAVVAAIHPGLRALGFRKRRHTFNRTTESGIVQVVNLQMGQKLPPGARPIPGLRPDLHGRFTVNLGVAVAEMWEFRFAGKPFPQFLNDYDCDIRERLGQVLGARVDVWWPLDEPAAVAREVGDAVHGPGEAWLAARAGRERILEIWEVGGLAELPTPTAIPLVMILRHLGRDQDGARLLRSYYEGVTHAAHRRHVYEVSRRLGISGLAPPD